MLNYSWRTRLEKTSTSRVFSLLLLICGAAILGLIIIEPFHEKIAIVGSAFALLSILLGTYLLDNRKRPVAPVLSRPLTCHLPLVVIILANLFALGHFAPPISSAFILAAAVIILIPLSKVRDVSKAYTAFLTVFLAGSIAYNEFYYYPLVKGPDAIGNLAVASAITQGGHYSDIIAPILVDEYYRPFPVMSIAPAILSLVSALDLEQSVLVFPGSLILLQPLLVFLVSRLVFDDSVVAALSSLIVVTESVVIQYINGPIAQSTAISLLLILMVMLFGRVQSKKNLILGVLLFLTLVALHGAVGLLSIVLIGYLTVRRGIARAYRRVIRLMVGIFLGYLITTGAIEVMVRRTWLDVNFILDFIFAPTLRTGGEVYGTSNGVVFISWGLPVSLAIFSVLLQRRKLESYWAYAGLGLLGVSFAVNIITPQLTIDRYGGLTAWLILAVSGGKALNALTRTTRQLLVLVPIILLVSLSGVLNPSLSPQYGHQGYQGVLPTTESDRAGLEWINRHVNGNVVSDSDSALYLAFVRYRSGIFSDRGIHSVNYRSTEITNLPNHDNALFVRCSNSIVVLDGEESCLGLAAALLNQRSSRIINILYSNSCGVLETNPTWP